MNNRNINVTAYEVCAVVGVMLMTMVLVGYLYNQLSLSRANEKEMSKRYSELVRTNTPHRQ
jgi:hypothetical protein